MNFEQIPVAKQEEDEEKTGVGIAKEALEGQKAKRKKFQESEADIITGEEETQMTATGRKKIEDKGFESTRVLSEKNAEIDTKDISLPEEIRERTAQESRIIEDAKINLKHIIDEGGTSAEFKDSVFSLIEDVLSEFGNKGLDKIFVREKIFKEFKDILKKQANKEFYIASEKANLLFEDTSEKREKLAKQVYEAEKRYIHILKDIFDSLELGEQKGGSFDIEGERIV